MYYLMLYTFEEYITSLTKIAYHRPRPYMTSLDLIAYSCQAQYGNPSGHSIVSSCVMFTFFMDVFFSKNNLYARTNKVLFYVLLVLNVLFVFMVMLSRLYLGVHSIDEVVLGFCFGTWLAFFMHFVIKDPLFDNVETLLYDPLNVPKPYLLKTLLFVTVVISVFFLTVVAVYEFLSKYWTIPDEWVTNLYI